MSQATTKRIGLDDAERAMIRRRTDKMGYVGIVEFHNGPRGGRYRSLRTTATATYEGAERAAKALHGRNWKQAPKKPRVVLVDAFGNVAE